MKIIDYRKSEDRLDRFRGVEIYPFLQPDENHATAGYIQVHEYNFHDASTGRLVAGEIVVSVNSVAKYMTPEHTAQMLAALALAHTMAMEWQANRQAEKVGA